MKEKINLEEKKKMIIKKKMKDITYDEYKKWKEKICNISRLDCGICPFRYVQCSYSLVDNCWVKNKNLYSDEFLNQEIEVEIPDILDDVEKKYLRKIIAPWKSQVVYIKKASCTCADLERIKIYYTSYGASMFLLFPLFIKNTMYKGMEVDKEYTLKELGL